MHVTGSVVAHRDTCTVYLVRTGGTDAIAIDFGAGTVLDRLGDYGIDRITDVLMTHHHRDQAQGLARAADAGIRIWVPPSERDLFARIDEHWQGRRMENSPDLRQDRFSLLEDVPVHGFVPEYRKLRFGDVDVLVLPTPGHTPGSVSYLVDIDDTRVAFTGDLLYGGGKVWSLAATQWTYSGLEGAAMSVLSMGLLSDHAPALVLPSHGDPISDVPSTVALTRQRLQELVAFQPQHPSDDDLESWLRHPFEQVGPHLLRNRTSIAASYVLLSDAGTALLFDYGYDMSTGLPAGGDRSARRPWLASIAALKADYGIDRVEVAVPTHYHDDHVAGFGLLHDVEGTEIWAGEEIAPILRDPRRYDLPCLWWDPLPVHRAVPAGRPVTWREYELTMFPLPGHTLYAAAIAFEADGRRILATGDQQDGGWSPDGARETLNFHYRNRFRIDDFVDSARLYQRLRPDVMISGHWLPREVDDAYLAHLQDRGEELARLHRALLPLEDVDFGVEGAGARIEPYRSEVPCGGSLVLDVEVRNPFPRTAVAEVRLVLPRDWVGEPPAISMSLAGRSSTVVRFGVRAPDRPGRRIRLAANLVVERTDFGQQAEALVDVVPPSRTQAVRPAGLHT